jgi:hypothetical protein
LNVFAVCSMLREMPYMGWERCLLRSHQTTS